MKETVVIMKNNFLGTINAMTQSKRMLPALMTLALLAEVLVVTGCKPHH